ncbi:MAG: hypothetical protein ACOVS5_12245, partial [Oligoflexus sp.]
MTNELIQAIDPNKVDAIRIVSERGGLDQVVQFCRRIKREVPLAKEKLPLIVDLYDHARGLVVELEGPRELKFGDEVTISKP